MERYLCLRGFCKTEGSNRHGNQSCVSFVELLKPSARMIVNDICWYLSAYMDIPTNISSGPDRAPQVPTADRSIVMVDWSRLNEPTPGNRNQFLWHQMILALLYDNVHAQDETLVCSTRMARWFHDNESFRLLEQLFLCGGIGVLKRPWQRYPAGRLQDLALQKPISARREHLAKFSVNNDGDPLFFDKRHVDFHDRLEDLLARQPHAHRYAGSENKLGNDLMQEFGHQLEIVLTDLRYSRWLKSNFKSITPQVAQEVVRFIHDPNSAIEHIAQTRPDRQPKYTPQAGGPTFSTALAVQVAATYEKDQAKDLQNLVETVFARPFCLDEGADGRYGRMLRDLPVPLEDEGENSEISDLRKIEVLFNIPLTLPLPGPNFGEVIETVRGSQSGRGLRSAMSQIGDDFTFSRVTNAWKAVAQEIAPMVGRKGKQISVRMVVIPLIKETVWGTLTDFIARPPTSKRDALHRAGGPFLRGASEVGGEVLSKLRQADLERQRISRQLENAVEFSCVRHPTIKSGSKT